MPRRSETFRGPLGLNFAACLLAATLFGAAACAGGQTSKDSQKASQPSATPARITPQELAKLRWIEGTWRGTRDDGKPPFYERYHFEGDSLVVEGFAEETMSKVARQMRLVIMDGLFGNDDGPYWAASEITDDSVTFVPVKKGVTNSFRWQRESGDTWKAVLDWPAEGGKPARRLVYMMERWPASK